MEQNNYDVSMSLGDWLITLVLLCIPCVNLIMLFIWAFGSTPETKKNFARASLIMMLISIVLSAVFGATIFSSLIALSGN